jgi:hypothetical protein
MKCKSRNVDYLPENIFSGTVVQKKTERMNEGYSYL